MNRGNHSERATPALYAVLFSLLALGFSILAYAFLQ